jgi:hypothetical protein
MVAINEFVNTDAIVARGFQYTKYASATLEDRTLVGSAFFLDSNKLISENVDQ